MADYTQANRPIAITTPLGKDVLLLTGFEGQEAISQLFRFELDLLAHRQKSVSFDGIVGQSVTVEQQLPGGRKRYVNGIVSRFSQGARDETFVHFRAEMVPKLWLLTKKVRSRIFQHLPVLDILKKVLAGMDVKYEIVGNYDPRDYCAQYRESDFAFASRLMEEEGIYYFFKHSDGNHQMVVTDAPQQHPDLPGQSDVIFEEMLDGGKATEMRVLAWEKTQELRSGKYTLWDHCFELPGKNLEAKKDILDSVPVGKVSHKLKVGGNDQLEIYDFPGAYAQRFDGVDKGGGDRPADLQKIFKDNERTVKIRMEQEGMPGLEIRGTSDCGHFVPGHRFTLTRHFDADGPYLLTRVEHRARLDGDYRSGGALPFTYQNQFTCIPNALPYRPPRITSRPTIASTQTATVVGPPGEEIFVDKYGRVKVQFHWDREGKKNLDSSCWVRVAQPWAGKGWGAFFWPRIGNEVVVSFEEGDPDQPLIVGSVYNAENMPPFALPKRNTFSGFKSCSLRGSAHQNFNGILFIDTKGREHLAIHSERHMSFNSEFDKSFHAGRHKHEAVSNMATLRVGSLPGGGGSGGGPDYSPLGNVPPNGVPGLNSIMVYGENLQVAVGINHQLAVGSNLQICINPVAIASALGLDPPAAIAGLAGSGLGGNMQLTLGTSANIVLGSTFTCTLGGKENWSMPNKSHVGTEIVCGLLGAAILLWVFLYAQHSDPESTADSRVSLVVVGQALISVLLLALMTVEGAYQKVDGDFLAGLTALFKPSGSPTTPDQSGLTIGDALIGTAEMIGIAALAVAPLAIQALAESDASTDQGTTLGPHAGG